MEELKKQHEFLIQGAGGGASNTETRYPVEEPEGVSTATYRRTYDNEGNVIQPGAVSLTQIEVLDLLSEGEIDGLVTGEYDYSFGTVGQVGYSSVPFTPYASFAGVRWLRSIYWNNVPVVNSNNQANFSDITVNVTNGLPNGSSVARIKPDLTVSRTIGERLRAGTDFAKTYRILNTNCKSVDINIRIAALSMTVVGREFEGNATLDYKFPNEIPKTSADEQGDTEATAVHYQLYSRPVFSQGSQQNFKLIKNEEVFGKISYGFIKKTTISLTVNNEIAENPDFIGWEIKINRLTPDSISNTVRNTTYIDSITEIYGDVYTYPNSAIVAQKFSAESFSQVPNRSFDVKLLKVKIPSNYDPITRQYTNEPWDGTWKDEPEWTDNPAFCFHDLVTNSRYGLGKYINENLIDKWTLYEIAKYCDTLVDDGYGKFEPRFTCNLLLTNREEAYKVLNDMVSIFRGIIYYGAGSIFTVQDTQKDSFFQFTNANVENGDFSYSSSSRRVRHTVALVRYNDRHNNFAPAVEYVEDIDGIRQYGIRELEITAFGCTSRGMALRLGRWALLSETLETENITFTAGLEGSLLRPGDVFQISDSNRNLQRYGGRTKLITNATGQSTVRLDSYITGFNPTTTYTLSLLTPTFNYDPLLVSGDLTSDDIDNIRRSQLQQRTFLGSVASGITGSDNNTYTQITLNTPFSTGNYSFTGNPVWVIEESGSQSSISSPVFEKYRVVSIKEEEGYKFIINGLQYNEDKYLAIDSGLAFEDPIFGQRPPPPQNLLLTIQTPTVNSKLIRYSFVPQNSPLASSFYVYAKTGAITDADISGSNYLAAVLPITIQSGFYLPSVTGNYYFRVYSSNKYGQKSNGYASNNILIENIQPIKDVTINSLMISSGVGNNTAGNKITQLAESESPTFKWQAGLNGSLENFETDFKYKVTIRQQSTNSTPSSNIYWTATGIVNNEYTFNIEDNALAVSNNGTRGPFRNYDVVVEATDNDGNSSAGLNFNNSNGYDILSINNPRPQIPLTTGACLPSNSFCTEQWFTSDGDVRILFTKYQTVNDLAGGYLYWSYSPFTIDQAVGRVPSGGATINTVQFDNITNPIIINANITGSSNAYIAIAPFDTFDEFLINQGSGLRSQLSTSNIVKIQKRSDISNNIFHAWVELAIAPPSLVVNNGPASQYSIGVLNNNWRNFNNNVNNVTYTNFSYLVPTTTIGFLQFSYTIYARYYDIYFNNPFYNTNYGVVFSSYDNYPQPLTVQNTDNITYTQAGTTPPQGKLSIQKFPNKVRVFGLNAAAGGTKYFIGIIKGTA